MLTTLNNLGSTTLLHPGRAETGPETRKLQQAFLVQVDLMITSRLQVDCQDFLSTSSMQVVLTSCSKSYRLDTIHPSHNDVKCGFDMSREI